MEKWGRLLTSKAQAIKDDLKKCIVPEKVAIYQKFFKTGKGEYGEGDKFLGISVPNQRIVAKKHLDTNFDEIIYLLHSPYHEHRMTALIILTYQCELAEKKKDEKSQKAIFDFYLANTKFINNWDLVDVTCHIIVGRFLLDKNTDTIYKLAHSKNMWERRIAMVATYAFIRKGIGKHTYKLAEEFLNETNDLMHKASGWMLREAGKRISMDELEKFVRKHHKVMPRTMLRYAIERFPETKRKNLLTL